MADNFVKHILMLESLIRSDREAPKTARQIQAEVERRWKEIFPTAPADDKPLSLQTIHRQVKAIKASGLYNIKSHADNKLGYYNTSQILSTAEVAVISAAIYQSASLNVDEKKRILTRLKSATDTDGTSIIYSFERQIKIDDKPNIRTQSILHKVKTICRAIVEGKTITFSLRKNSAADDWHEVTASPCFITGKDNELYLTALVGKAHEDFKVALMRNIEIQSEEFQSEKNFSLKQHLDRTREDAPLIELKISFPESFIENVIARFGRNRISHLASNGRIEDGENQYRVTIHLREDERLYDWLRRHCNKVKVAAPNAVKANLKNQLLKAIGVL